MSNRASRHGSAQAGKVRVVLVDDSALFRATLAGWLCADDRFLIVGLAETGSDGFILASQLEPDLVITDLYMPGVDGLQLVEMLHQKYPEMRLVLVSSHDGPALQAASLRLGADAFITKQHLPAELLEVLNRLFPVAAEAMMSP